MVTFKPIIVTTNRHIDGSFPVKIRITYKGKSRRLPTTLVARPNDLTRTLKIKSADLLMKGNELCDRMRQNLNDVSPFLLAEWDVEQVVQHIKTRMTEQSFSLDFFAFSNECLKAKKVQTAEAYRTALSALSSYIGSDRLDINAITRTMVVGYIDYLQSKKIATLRSYVQCLHHLHDAAKFKYNDEDAGVFLIPRSPFSNISLPAYLPQGQKSLGVETMQRLISDKTENKRMREALDIFIVSFALMGANIVDLYYASKPRDGIWTYNRIKTSDRRRDKAEMRIEVPDCIKPHIDRLKGTGNHWLNRITRFADHKIANQCVNVYLKRWCRENKVAPFTFYAARHTWATIARQECGIEKATIDDCLCHIGNYQVADIYAEKSWRLINEANAKVLALFDWD